MTATAKEILIEALKLDSTERSILIESLITSLDYPDPKIEAVWLEEAEQRLAAYREGRLKGVPLSEALARS
jgi:hypothetical protein